MVQSVSFKQQEINRPKAYDKNLPYKAAALNTVVWMGVGLGTDYLVTTKLFKSKFNKKLSLILNSAFGLAMGVYTYFKTKKLQKNDNINNVNDMIDYFDKKHS